MIDFYSISMITENEVKVRVSPDIEKILRELFEFIAEEEHEDIYFNAPDRDFRKTDEALRLRRTDGKVFLTYKEARKDSRMKSRNGIQVELSDFEKARELLKSLGFSEVIRMRKSRKVFRKDDITLCLDEVEFLGTFIEVEVLGDNVEEAERKIEEVLKELGLSDEELITESYLELLLKLK